jgi:hypothetical protein
MPLRFGNSGISQNLINAALVGVAVLLVFGCLCRSNRETRSPQSEKTKTEQTPVQNDSEPASRDRKNLQNEDSGDFVVDHGTLSNAAYKEIDRQIKEEKVLEDAARQLNENLKLPNDVILRTKDCSEVNAFYDPNDTSITVCYELMEHFFKLFKANGESEQKAYERMFDAVRFVFLHELGHAMIDLYRLPVTGNEEDAADRVSAYICLEEIDDGVNSVFAAADAFAIESKARKPGAKDLADEHLLQEQRFYNSLCMIYGSDTVKYSKILTEGYLPKDRAVRCAAEYERTMQSWKELLRPWRKN